MDGSEAMAAIFGAIERFRGKAIDSLPAPGEASSSP